MGEQTLKRTVSAAIMLLLTLIFMIGALISYRSGDGVRIRAHSAYRAEIMRGGDGEDAALPASVLPGELVDIHTAGDRRGARREDSQLQAGARRL